MKILMTLYEFWNSSVYAEKNASGFGNELRGCSAADTSEQVTHFPSSSQVPVAFIFKSSIPSPT